MELTPEDIDTDEIKARIMKIPEVDYIDDLHCWALAGGKNVLTAHIYLKRTDLESSGEPTSADTNEISPSNWNIQKVYKQANDIVYKYDVCHSTLQVL